MLDKDYKIQKKLNFHISVELSSITKKEEIQGPCLVLVIE
jgi:hypothetical protein